MRETKEYKECLEFYKKIIEKGFLKDLNISSTKQEIYEYDEGEEFKWVVKKFGWYDLLLEIRVEYHNIGYLINNPKITKTQYKRNKVTKCCYIYSVKQNKRCLDPLFLEAKEKKKPIQFIYKDLWFRDFSMKNVLFFTKI
jgi:hypothetical protein